MSAADGKTRNPIHGVARIAENWNNLSLGVDKNGALFIQDGQSRRPIAARDIFVLAFTNSECREIGETLRAAAPLTQISEGSVQVRPSSRERRR